MSKTVGAVGALLDDTLTAGMQVESTIVTPSISIPQSGSDANRRLRALLALEGVVALGVEGQSHEIPDAASLS